MRANYDQVEIQASPEEVWDVLTDLSKHADWNPLIYRAEGTVEVGQKIELSARTASTDLNYTCYVVRVEPGRELQWIWHIIFPFLIRGDHTFTIEPIDEQSVRFLNLEIFKGILVPLPAKDLMTNGKDAMVAMDRALKSRVEQLHQTA
jgi:hypothetical protein